MELSLALILDELELEADVSMPEGVNPRFTSVELYVVGETQFVPEKLLVCPLSEAIVANKQGGAYFLCVRDRMVDEQENEHVMKGITVVRQNIGMRELFNRVQRVFVKVKDWIMAMQSSTASGGGLQELLDLSEPVFRNFITVQDGTFKLIARTKGIEPPDAIMRRLIKHGYHPPETMDLLQRVRRVEQFRTSTEIVISRDRLTSEYDVVKKTYHVGGSIFIMVVMVCCGKPANSAVLELFATFIEYIKAYADSEIAQTGGIGGVKKLALDILTKNVGNKEEARIRSAYCGYPFEGCFRLYVFKFEDENNVPIANLVQTLSETFRESVVFSSDRSILLIEHGQQESDALDMINDLLPAGFTCGISDSFGSLWELPIAHEQALIASDITARMKLNKRLGKEEKFCLFTKNLIYHIISSCCKNSPGVFENSFPARAVTMLREYDNQHRTETMRILRLFLENERSATAVASIMHMHRNTVLYHIERISELLKISLNDPEIRLQLLLAFKADDLN